MNAGPPLTLPSWAIGRPGQRNPTAQPQDLYQEEEVRREGTGSNLAALAIAALGLLLRCMEIMGQEDEARSTGVAICRQSSEGQILEAS